MGVGRGDLGGDCQSPPQFSTCLPIHFYPTALKGCWGIVFTHGVRIRLVIYYSQSITITFENIQSITITFKNFKSITITITVASITSITFYYILLQFGANLRGNFNTEIKLTGYFIHLILLKMFQIMPYKDKISQIYHLVYLRLN